MTDPFTEIREALEHYAAEDNWTEAAAAETTETWDCGCHLDHHGPTCPLAPVRPAALPAVDAPPPKADPSCSGADDCDAATHFHGCFADDGNCDEPDEHEWPDPVPVDAPPEPTT